VKMKKDTGRISPEGTLTSAADPLETDLDSMALVATAQESANIAACQSPRPVQEEDTPPTINQGLSLPADPPCKSPGVNESEHPHTETAETLAHRIQALLFVFPQACTPSTLFSFGSSNDSKELPSGSGSGRGSAETTLLSLLSSASTVNALLLKGRSNAWSIFDRSSPQIQSVENDTTICHDTVQMNSVVISCPLQPTDDTEVEIAKSDIVSIETGEEEEEEEEEALEKDESLTEGIKKRFLRKDKGKGKATSTEKTDPHPVMGEEVAAEKTDPHLITVKEVRVWYPSRTKISLETTWWGYRIYLPPPVMRVLSDKSLEAAKRAALITTALSWLVKRIPISMLPPQLKPAVLVVGRIVPSLGYVGGFIAWSWTTVQGFDKGHGVILSATWLLPIALVPGTWFYTDNKPCE